MLFQDLTSQHSSLICSRTELFSEHDHEMQISFVSAFLVLLARVRPRRYLYRPAIRQIGFYQKPASQAISLRAARIINNKNMWTFGSMLARDEGHPRKWITDPACKHSRAHFDIDATCRVWDDNNIALYGFHRQARMRKVHGIINPAAWVAHRQPAIRLRFLFSLLIPITANRAARSFNTARDLLPD